MRGRRTALVTFSGPAERISNQPVCGSLILPRKLSPSLSSVRKELQPDKSEEDKRQGTYTTSICALAKKDHSNHRGSRGGDPDGACVDRCRRETLNGFGQQVIYGNGAEHTHHQRCPWREWRGPFQNERPCDFEKICEKDEEPRHRLSLDEDSERRALVDLEAEIETEQ